MAAPVFTSLVASPAKLPPGGQSVVRFTASDPDADVILFVGKIKDLQGNLVPKNVTIEIDPLTYTLEDVDGKGAVIVQRPDELNVFDVTVPL